MRQLAAAVASHIAALPCLPTGTDVSDSYLDDFELKTLRRMRIRVYPTRGTAEPQSRGGRNGGDRHERTLTVVLSMKLGEQGKALIDDCVDVAEEVYESLRRLRPADLPECVCVSREWAAVALPEKLYQTQTFHSIILATFRDPA